MHWAILQYRCDNRIQHLTKIVFMLKYAHHKPTLLVRVARIGGFVERSAVQLMAHVIGCTDLIFITWTWTAAACASFGMYFWVAFIHRIDTGDSWRKKFMKTSIRLKCSVKSTKWDMVSFSRESRHVCQIIPVVWNNKSGSDVNLIYKQSMWNKLEQDDSIAQWLNNMRIIESSVKHKYGSHGFIFKGVPFQMAPYKKKFFFRVHKWKSLAYNINKSWIKPQTRVYTPPTNEQCS